MKEIVSNRYTARRLAVYFIGLIILSLGIDLNTKAHLGISPIVSFPYNVSAITGVMLGVATFIWYVSHILLQILILKKDFKIWQFLQVPCAFLTSAGMQLFDEILPDAKSMPMRIAVLILAVILTAIGAGIVVAMNIVPNPADGLASAIGKLAGKDYGFGKNIVDVCSIALALLLGWICTGGILGIGIGTFVSMIFTGRVAAMLRGYFRKIYMWTQS